MLKRNCKLMMYLALTVLLLLLTNKSYAQPEHARKFLKSLCGEWIGMWDHTTNGQKADTKYFHLQITEVDENRFESVFKYYRFDTVTNTLVQYGETTVSSTVEANGSITNQIRGEGTVLVDNKQKPQTHDLTETLTEIGEGTWVGLGSGKLEVDDLPFGIGKNGKVHEVTSTWTLNNDTLTITESLSAQFRFLFFTKDFVIEAHAKAQRGNNLASLIGSQVQIAEKELPETS